MERVAGDLSDAEGLKRAAARVDHVFHVAGRTVAFQAQQFFADNLDGTQRLADACAARTTPPALLLVSSLAAGGTGTIADPRSEEQADQPISTYGRSKLAGEHAAIAASSRLPVSMIRPPMVFGQADRASLQLFRSMKLMPIHLSPGMRSFPISLIHVTDLCDAIVRIATTGERAAPPDEAAPGQGRYYAAAERHISYGELGQLAARAAGWMVATLPVPTPIFWAAGSLGEAVGRLRGRASLINFDKVREATARGWVCSDDKIRTTLGYQPAATLEERFAETVDWYREHKWL